LNVNHSTFSAMQYGLRDNTQIINNLWVKDDDERDQQDQNLRLV